MTEEDNYRLIIEKLTDGVVMIDREARCRYANPAALRILQRTDIELVGHTIWEVVADPFACTLRQNFDRVAAGEEVMVLRNFLTQGRWYEAVAVPAGERILVMLRDITERLQAEAARRQTEERCRIMVEGVKDHAIFLLDLKARIATWNRGAEAITEYRATDAMGKDVSLFLPEKKTNATKMGEGMLAAVSERGFHYRGVLARKDGSQFFADVTANAVYDELGQPNGFACVMRDITEQERMDNLLRLSEERLRMATAAGDIGIWEYVFATGKFKIDDRVRSMYALPPDDTQSYVDLLCRINPADRLAVEQEVRRAIVAKRGIHVEHRTTTSQGNVMWVESDGTALFDDEGKPQRIIGTTRDVTERHRNDEFRELVPGILAHDLRSPLAAIKMAAEQLGRRGNQDAQATQIAANIGRSADNMARMVARLLEFTEARFGGGLPIDRAPTDLGDVAREVVAETRVAHPDSELHFEVKGNTRGRWDPVRLGEVASNLIGNAIKYGAHGDPIDVAVLGIGSDVQLKVHNTGPPIPEETIPVIYEPFVGAGRHPGKPTVETSLGLGLYITRELVHAHGGSVEVSSSTEAGTTFTVHLPR